MLQGRKHQFLQLCRWSVKSRRCKEDVRVLMSVPLEEMGPHLSFLTSAYKPAVLSNLFS